MTVLSNPVPQLVPMGLVLTYPRLLGGPNFLYLGAGGSRLKIPFMNCFTNLFSPRGLLSGMIKKEQILRHTSHCIHDESLDRLISFCRRFNTCRTDWESLFAPTWSQYCTHFGVYTPHILLKDVLLHWSIVSITLSLNPSSARACCCNELPLSTIVLPAGGEFPSGFLKGRNNSSLSTSIAMGSSHRVFASNKPGLCWPEGDHCYGFGLVWS